MQIDCKEPKHPGAHFFISNLCYFLTAPEVNAI